MSTRLIDGIRNARISVAMTGLHPELANVLPPEDWPEVLSRLQGIYRRVTNQPDAALVLRATDTAGEDDGWPSSYDGPMIGNSAARPSRELLGRLVREAWVRWARTQQNPKPSWLVPYDELSEPDKEADRHIGESVFDAAYFADGAKKREWFWDETHRRWETVATTRPHAVDQGRAKP